MFYQTLGIAVYALGLIFFPVAIASGHISLSGWDWLIIVVTSTFVAAKIYQTVQFTKAGHKLVCAARRALIETAK